MYGRAEACFHTWQNHVTASYKAEQKLVSAISVMHIIMTYKIQNIHSFFCLYV